MLPYSKPSSSDVINTLYDAATSSQAGKQKPKQESISISFTLGIIPFSVTHVNFCFSSITWLNNFDVWAAEFSQKQISRLK